MESKLEEARERSRRIWDAMAPGWETGRQDLWEFSRPISEWLVERLDGADPVLAEARDAGERARSEVGTQMRALLSADIDEQRTTPLQLLRGAVRYPTEVLRAAEVPPVDRDQAQAHLFPEDVYDLSPATFADVDPALLAASRAENTYLTDRRPELYDPASPQGETSR